MVSREGPADREPRCDPVLVECGDLLPQLGRRAVAGEVNRQRGALQPFPKEAEPDPVVRGGGLWPLRTGGRVAHGIEEADAPARRLLFPPVAEGRRQVLDRGWV